jgi:DNA-directed RNA polymerase subunit RPC12/RpoP
MRCGRCGSENINISIVTDIKTKNRGCLAWSMWILLAICTFGLILIIPAITNTKVRTKQRKIATCQYCGHSWKC